MIKDTTYAVVDMETTGTDINNDEKIIQFSAVFVKNGHVINSYSTYINDGKRIPKDITDLTGIDANTLKNAPSFDEVAPHIYKMLQNTVFVAHNVNFDFPFLNTTFEKVGYPELNIDAIDTVTLTQIFFPTLSSYKLSHLSKYFKIKHNHPHSSASDAAATADLLIIIFNKIKSLPLTTLKSILEIDFQLPKQTKNFIKNVYKQKLKEKQSFPENLVNVNGIVLAKHQGKISETRTKFVNFPKNKKQKEKLLGKKFQWRDSQSKMMNLIYRNYTDTKKKTENLLIEAPTGSGKTLGYLLPLAFLVIQNNKPAVISTATIALQEQLVSVIKKDINQYFGFNFNVLELKGKHHYIDLTRFINTLIVDDSNKLTQFIKAQILVWLTETKTGDLDELRLPDQADFVNQINYKNGVNSLDNEFGEYDFLKTQQASIRYADFIIVNHDYLFNNAKIIADRTDSMPYLLVDEAHQLAKVAFESQKKSFWLGTVKSSIGRVHNDTYQTHEKNLTDIFENEPDFSKSLNTMLAIIESIGTINASILNLFNDLFVRKLKGNKRELSLKQNKMVEFNKNNQSLLKKQAKLAKQLEHSLNILNRKISSNSDKWLNSDYEVFLKFNKHVHQIVDFISSLKLINDNLNNDNIPSIFWLEYSNNQDINNITLKMARYDANNELSKKIYKYFEPAIFTGAALFTSKKSQYIYDQLDLKRSNTRMRRLKNNFDYTRQLQISIAKQTPMPETYENDEYVSFIANSIQKIYAKKPVPTLVLFNSNKLIEAVYNKMSKNGNYNLYASGITGSVDKIYRRFESNSHSIILGSNVFWEGIDFSKHYLKSIIIPRIPFASPDNPIVRGKSAFLKSQNKNPFTSYSLPQAIMLLKQGIGRLIRNQKDYGTVTILDDRIITRKYGKQILHSIANETEPQRGSISDITNINAHFLDKHQ